jgi:PadR family transcriptional regulator PadR
MGPTATRQSQLLRGVLDLCLLAVIADEPAYGYEMTRRLADRGLTTVGEGSIYPLLGRLERDGLVETFHERTNGGPPRKYYRPTRVGRRALDLWRNDWLETRNAVDNVVGTKGVSR